MKFNLKTYCQYKSQFHLGGLTTESLHPSSLNLSHEVQKDLAKAIETLQDIDRSALEILKNKAAEVFELQRSCQKVLKNKGSIFLTGCGATGRLALSIEKAFRFQTGKESVKAFMAGGDYALIKSVERFEDNIEYGERQLDELGFTSNDLVIGITEGGETSFVIGTVLKAAVESKLEPYFLFCNPEEELKNLDRCRLVLNNNRIKRINLSVGPMAISGSTRMQASTVQMIATGFAVLYDHKNFEDFEREFVDFINELQRINLAPLDRIIEAEARVYQHQGLVTYLSPPDLAIAILTDTTERSPTFNLRGFEKQGETEFSLSYLAVENYQDNTQAWIDLLGRAPRCIKWGEFKIDKEELFRFDISEASLARRARHKDHEIFRVDSEESILSLSLGQHNATWKLSADNLFLKLMYLKLILNTHSTLVMGKLGRYQGNMMTYVRPSNLKLVNRAYRYIDYLLKQEQIDIHEDEVVAEIFRFDADSTEPVVLSVFEKLKARIKTP